LKAQQAAIDAVKVGKKCSEVYEIAKKRLRPMSRYFTHGLGHGVGVEVHELPNLKQKSKDRIKLNQVFTIEPGIYIPKKYGIRIEDVIAVTKKGVKILTKMPRELRVIKQKVY